MKIELKHLSGYLPYGLEFILSEKGIFNLDCENEIPSEAYEPMKIIDILICDKIEVEIHSEKRNWGIGFIELDEIKPILRPLSDLTKEIEVNGEKFVPLDWYDKNCAPLNCSHEEMKSHFMKETLKVMPYVVIEKLLEWHFDIHGLIDAGLAVDINTL